MKIDRKIVNKFDKMLKKTDVASLKDIMIIQTAPKSYNLFDQYDIRWEDGLYKVYCITAVDDLVFNALKTAVAWCIFDRRVKVTEAKRILELDRHGYNTIANIEVLTRLVRTAKKDEDKLVYLAKLGEEKLRSRQINEELEGYIHESRVWQMGKFKAKS